MNAALVWQAVLEHIEAECNDMQLSAGELAENVLELIRAGKIVTAKPRYAAPPAPACAGCVELRGRLRSAYHSTLTYQDASEALAAVRDACGPGASAPPAPAAGIE